MGAPGEVYLEAYKSILDRKFFFLVVSAGFLGGLWMVYCSLLFKKSWRIAYFQSLAKLYDMAYVFVSVKWATWAKKWSSSS